MWSKAKHRRARHEAPRCHTVEVVDARSGMAHQLTSDAYAAGFHPQGSYIALCGKRVLPASLTAPPEGRCRSCIWTPERARVPRVKATGVTRAKRWALSLSHQSAGRARTAI